jgi:hypothetical protein
MVVALFIEIIVVIETVLIGARGIAIADMALEIGYAEVSLRISVGKGSGSLGGTDS